MADKRLRNQEVSDALEPPFSPVRRRSHERLLIATAAFALGLGAAVAQTIVVTPDATAEFKTYITTEKVKDVDVDVDVTVGTALPDTVVLTPVPEVIVTKSPELKGYRFAVVKGKTVIVEPSSTKIVAIVN